MSLIVDDLVPTETLEFEKLPRYKPDYEHLKCDCGGIIGVYGDYHCRCEQCHKVVRLVELTYDRILINDKTGWMFPVKWRD